VSDDFINDLIVDESSFESDSGVVSVLLTAVLEFNGAQDGLTGALSQVNLEIVGGDQLATPVTVLVGVVTDNFDVTIEEDNLSSDVDNIVVSGGGRGSSSIMIEVESGLALDNTSRRIVCLDLAVIRLNHVHGGGRDPELVANSPVK